MLIVIQIFKFCLDKTGRNKSRYCIFYIMFLNSSNQLNALVIITFCEKVSRQLVFVQHFWHLLKFPQLSSSFFQFCPDKTGRNRPKVIDFFYPSALRAGGVLSSRSGRAGGRTGGQAGGRLPDLRNPYLCNRLMDFLHSKFYGIV